VLAGLRLRDLGDLADLAGVAYVVDVGVGFETEVLGQRRIGVDNDGVIVGILRKQRR
jgi:hypothetical protein